MLACEYLAKVGLAWMSKRVGFEPSGDPDDPRDAAADEIRRHRLVATMLLDSKVSAGFGDGAQWIVSVTWPDRVPGLVTWSGQQTLPKLIKSRIEMLGSKPIDNLYKYRAAAESVTGIDGWCAQSAIDIGFSPSAHGMLIQQRPAVELLAILGLESVPLVSFAGRECGFVHSGKVWRFQVEERDGRYYHRWGEISEVLCGS